MKLPNGITGFYSSKNNRPSKVDGRQFRQVCFSITTRFGGKVLDFKEPEYPTNFYKVDVKLYNKQFHILLNEYYPYLGFASVVEFENIKFIDVPDLSREFSSFYKVLSVNELHKPLVIKQNSEKIIIQNDNDLNSAELEQVAFWKPERIGEVIFNYWD